MSPSELQLFNIKYLHKINSLKKQTCIRFNAPYLRWNTISKYIIYPYTGLIYDEILYQSISDTLIFSTLIKNNISILSSPFRSFS